MISYMAEYQSLSPKQTSKQTHSLNRRGYYHRAECFETIQSFKSYALIIAISNKLKNYYYIDINHQSSRMLSSWMGSQRLLFWNKDRSDYHVHAFSWLLKKFCVYLRIITFKLEKIKLQMHIFIFQQRSPLRRLDLSQN